MIATREGGSVGVARKPSPLISIHSAEISGSETRTLAFRGASKCSSATALPLSEEDNLLCIAEVTFKSSDIKTVSTSSHWLKDEETLYLKNLTPMLLQQWQSGRAVYRSPYQFQGTYSSDFSQRRRSLRPGSGEEPGGRCRRVGNGPMDTVT
ncbi:hypothetical protein DY000_02008518 [Brassica cretica]|uniref:Uncharacterized protein n=1 Tax=Brassica cretica TaxID=69181 RepID=A0ABQ7CM86_BRACR|nr:hypothetical protein DY000_02008518 [Brassica cretica]